MRCRWKMENPTLPDHENPFPVQSFVVSSVNTAEYATKYCTKEQGVERRAPLAAIQAELVKCCAAKGGTTAGSATPESIQTGKRRVAMACNAQHGAVVLSVTMATLYFMQGKDHTFSATTKCHYSWAFTSLSKANYDVRPLLRCILNHNRNVSISLCFFL